MNYQLELDNIIRGLEGRPRLLLHSCCGPCSSYVLEYLTEFFEITVLYYNPCIAPTDEYEHRKAVQKSLITKMNSEGKDISFCECDYNHDLFLKIASGLESEREGGERCHKCYRQRLEYTAEVARRENYDFFTTTLTVSPYKNATVLNELGLEISRNYGVNYLVSDFKKREGYKRSIELSKVYNLYRQDYCGCEFSIRGEKTT